MSRPSRATADLLARVQLTAVDRVRAQAALERADAIADAIYRLTEAVRAGLDFVKRRLRARLAKAA
jgi:hypothetical protein